MAQDNMIGITESLFGVQPSSRQDLAEGIALAGKNLTGGQIGGALGYAGMKQLGRGLMTATGTEDPEQAEANKVKTAVAQVQQQGINTQSSQGMKAVAQILNQQGDTALAFKATQVAQILEEKEASINLKQAQTVKALREPDEGVKALVQKSTPASVAKYMKTGNPADLELIDKGLTGSTLEKVASAEQNIQGLRAGNTEIDTWLSKVNPENPKVTFGIGSSLAAGASRLVSNPTENATQQASLRRFIAREVNDLLVAAKGTQTEGDARRAYDTVMNALDKNSNEDVYAALKDLKAAKEKVAKGLETYVSVIQGKGKTTPTTGVQSGKYADDYAKYKDKYGAQALPYDAYVAKREGR